MAVAAATPASKVDVCGLLTAKQVTAIAGVSAKCKNLAAQPGPGSTLYVGNWAGLTPKSATLQVTVAVYSDPGVLHLAVHNLKQGLPGGVPKPVAGIGTAAYEATGAMAAGIHVAVGNDVLYITMTDVGAPPKSAAVVEPVAKDVVAKLRTAVASS